MRVLRDMDADSDLPLPSYATAGAAGADLCANLTLQDRASGIEIAPGARRLVPTGLRLEIPEGYEVQLRPRSGLALRQGITLLNTPGTIDSDYRGSLGVLVVNHGSEVALVAHGERIAQMIVAPVLRAVFVEVADLSTTSRGDGGFGSTGG